MKKSTQATRAPRKPRSSRKKLPTTEEIQLRAYEIFLERRGAPGNALEDWIRAESELIQKYGARPRKSPRTPRNKAA